MGGKNNRRTRSGQTMIFLIMILLILAFVAIWNFDLHQTISVKMLSQNGGDGAALAAARWQGITLNLVGDLNIMQAVAFTQGDPDTAANVAELQARLCYVGPMVGLVAAQQAAKNNGVYTNEYFTSNVLAHANVVRTDYPRIGSDGQMLFPEPYPNCWQEYADMITVVAEQGVAAAPDNAAYYQDYTGGHLLLDRDFYDAIASENWCWFYHHAYQVLLNYTDYHWWPPLPLSIPHPRPINSEYFGLGLEKEVIISDARVVEMMDSLRTNRGLSSLVLSNVAGSVTSSWYCYDGGEWTGWTGLATNGADAFPISGPVRPQYDYAGADSVIRVLATASRLTPGASDREVTWTAAAKPFGYLNDDQRPNAYDLVLPAFHDIRLFPVDAATGGRGGAFDHGWRDHIEGHLPSPRYMAGGPSELDPGCYYCQQILKWDHVTPRPLPPGSTEPPWFRDAAKAWLAVNYRLCDIHGGGGGGGGGGRRRGH